MPKINTYQCENVKCGKLRKDDSNHWFHIHEVPGGFVVLEFGAQLDLAPRGINPVVELNEKANSALYFCGQACATEYVQRRIAQSTDIGIPAKTGK